MIIAANWKMNLASAAASLFEDYCIERQSQAKSEVICFVPSCYFALAEQSFLICCCMGLEQFS